MGSTLTLTSLAILKVDLDLNHRTYVDYIEPFVLEVLSKNRLEVITDTKTADAILDSFGLRIPVKVIQHVLRRLKKRGALKLQDGVFVQTQKLPKPKLAQARSEANDHINRVLNELRAEAAQCDLSWGDEEATSAVTLFLSKFGVDCLRTYVFKTALPKVPPQSSRDLYVVGRFLSRVYTENDPAFESFIVLVKGQMYANALLCPDLESLEKKFKSVRFFLDTPVLLNLIGLHGEGSERAATELVELLKKLDGAVQAFMHTIEETQQVISATAYNISDLSKSGRALQEAREKGLTYSDLMILKESIVDKLRLRGVSVFSTPHYDEDFQIDEEAFQSALDEEISYRGDSALLNDLNSVRSIYVLRKGKQPLRLEDCKAVLVTSNAAFAKAAFAEGRNHNSSREVSPVITDYSLATIAWLKSPLEAANLPAREALALSYAALEPSRELFKRYVEEMDRLRERGEISPSEHELLRLLPSAKEELMQLTLGEEKALSATSVKEILAHVKETILAEQEERHRRKISKIADDTTQERRAFEYKERELVGELSELKKSTRSFQDEISTLKDQVRDQKRRVNLVSTRIAGIVAKIILAATSIVLVVAALVSTGLFVTDQDQAGWIRLTVVGLTIVAATWGFYSWFSGASIRIVVSRLEERIKNRLMKVFEE